MTPFKEVSQMFGIHRMPWVIRVYLLLFIIVLIMAAYSALHIPGTLPANTVSPFEKAFEFSLDLLKLIIGALLGSLSLAATRQWGDPGTNKRLTKTD